MLFIVQVQSLRADEVPTMKQCVEGLTARRDLFLDADSVHIHCQWSDLRHLQLSEVEDQALQSMIRRGDLAGITETHPQQQIFRTPGYVLELALRNGKLFQRVVNPGDSKFGEEGTTGVFDGEFGLELSGTDHAYVGAKPPAYSWQNWDYAWLLNLNVLTNVATTPIEQMFPSGRQPSFLPDTILKDRSAFTIEGRELIDGVSCVVLAQKNKFKWWLDTARGWSPLKRERYVRAPDDSVIVESRVIMSDLREENPGLWLPRELTEELCLNPEIVSAKPESWGTPSVRWSLIVSQIEFDTLTDDFFRVPIPKGALVHDEIRNLEYFAVGSEDMPFAKAIGYAKSHLADQRAAQFWFYLINGVIVLGIIGLAVLGWRKRGGFRR